MGVLRSPSIAGALTSLLGPNYYVHPHRAIHTSRPVEDKSAVYDEDFNGTADGQGISSWIGLAPGCPKSAVSRKTPFAEVPDWLLFSAFNAPKDGTHTLPGGKLSL